MNIPSLVSRLSRYDRGEALAVVRTLLEDAFGLTYTDICCGQLPPDAELEPLMARLEAGEPVQYVTGKAQFCGHTFRVEPSTLIPRPETERLVELIIERCQNVPQHKVAAGSACRATQCDKSAQPVVGGRPTILDVGTGSGCIAIALALALPEAGVEAWDISAEALRVARHNAERLGAQVAFKQQDVFSLARRLKPAPHIIVSNPPYIAASEACDMEQHVLCHEPHRALFVPDDDPLRFYRAIAAIPASEYWLEINPRYAQLTAELFPNPEIINDQYGRQRFVHASNN